MCVWFIERLKINLFRYLSHWAIILNGPHSVNICVCFCICVPINVFLNSISHIIIELLEKPKKNLHLNVIETGNLVEEKKNPFSATNSNAKFQHLIISCVLGVFFWLFSAKTNIVSLSCLQTVSNNRNIFLLLLLLLFSCSYKFNLLRSWNWQTVG